MSSYTYPLSALTNGIDINTLESYIIIQFPTFTGSNINNITAEITFTFSSALSGGQQTSLISLLNTYNPVPKLEGRTNVIPLGATLTSSLLYEVIHIHKFEGKRNEKVKKCNLVTSPEGGVTSYSVTLLDITNNNVVASGTFTNTTSAIIDLGTLSNQSIDVALWELSCQINSTTIDYAGVKFYEMIFYA